NPPQVLPEEPTAVTPHGGFCGGKSQQWLRYPTMPHARLWCTDARCHSSGCNSWIRPARMWRCTAMPTWFGRSLGHAAYSSCRVLPVARARTRSPKPALCALGLRPADLLSAALGGRPRPRVAIAAFASAAEADLSLLPGVLPTRVSTRSAVSRSVN